MTIKDADVSRAISHALRHKPWLHELELDDEGWVPIDQLLAALHARGGSWESINRSDLERIVTSGSKQRHEITESRIRALYGHSVPGRIAKLPSVPPDRLFHGTAPDTWTAIRRIGLRPMSRQFVHLSANVEMATTVGRRKHTDPIILEVLAAEASIAGMQFFRGNDQVWLADEISVEFIRALRRAACMTRSSVAAALQALVDIPFPSHADDPALADWLFELLEVDGHYAGIATSMINAGYVATLPKPDDLDQCEAKLDEISQTTSESGETVARCRQYLAALRTLLAALVANNVRR